MPQFYFSLPRLIAKLWGGNAAPAETNWLEANVAGTAIHGIVYIFFARLLLSHLPAWQQFALLLPLAISLWVFWLLLFQIQSLIVRFLRGAGMLRHVSDSRAHGVLIGIITTALAFQLLAAGSWMRVVGAIWIAAVSLNLIAAVILAVSNADGPAVT